MRGRVSCREVSKYRDISRYLPLPVNLYIAIYRAIYAKWLAINDNDICLKNSDKYTNAKAATAATAAVAQRAQRVMMEAMVQRSMQ